MNLKLSLRSFVSFALEEVASETQSTLNAVLPGVSFFPPFFWYLRGCF